MNPSMLDYEVRRFVTFWQRRREDQKRALSVDDLDILTLPHCADGCCKDQVDLDSLAEALAELVGEPLPPWKKAAADDVTAAG